MFKRVIAFATVFVCIGYVAECMENKELKTRLALKDVECDLWKLAYNINKARVETNETNETKEA